MGLTILGMTAGSLFKACPEQRHWIIFPIFISIGIRFRPLMNIILWLMSAAAGAAVLVVVVILLLTPWMDRWGAMKDEIAATFPGDELVPNPRSFVNRAVTIQAAPEEIFPWLRQIGAGKGGFYTYTWIEALIGCRLVNADRIHPEWQDLQVGDLVRMCPGDPAPPPYVVAQIHPDEALVLGHQEDNAWVDLWQYALVPRGDGSTRLILRTRTMMTGGFWSIIHPGVFVMERGMLLGIKARVEKNSLPLRSRILGDPDTA